MTAPELVRMKLSCRDEAHFRAEFSGRLGSRVFVPMAQRPAVGERFPLHVRFADGLVWIKGTAEVLRHADAPRAGVVARFISLDEGSLQFPLLGALEPASPIEVAEGEALHAHAEVPHTMQYGTGTPLEVPPPPPPPDDAAAGPGHVIDLSGVAARPAGPTGMSLRTAMLMTPEEVEIPIMDDGPEERSMAPRPRSRHSGAGHGRARSTWAVVAVTGLAIGALGLALASSRLARGTAAAPSPASSELEAYLDEAERLARDGRKSQALDVLLRSDKLPGGTPHLAARVAQLKAELRVAISLRAASRQLGDGDSAAARSSLAAVLAQEPENAEARALLARLDAAVTAKPAAAPLIVVAPDVAVEGPGPHRRSPSAAHQPGRAAAKPASPLSEPERAAGRGAGVAVATAPAPDDRPTAHAIAALASKETPPAVTPGTAAPGTAAPAAVTPAAVTPAAATPAAVTPGAATPAPSAAAATPALRAQKPRLPLTHEVTSVQEVSRTFAVIEKEIAERGSLGGAAVRNVTVPLAEHLIAAFSPGTTVTVYPTAMYWFVVDQVHAGQGLPQIAQQLKAAHLQGRLATYQPSHER